MKKIRLKWVKNRGLDHIINRDTDLKAAILLKDAILSSPNSHLTIRSLSHNKHHPLHRSLALTIPTLRFLRRYPTLFTESPHPTYPSLPSFSLSQTAHLLHSRESSLHLSLLRESSDRLSRLLMMTLSRSLPLKSLLPLSFDLGLPNDFFRRSPLSDDLRIVSRDGVPFVELVNWRDDLAVSAVQRKTESCIDYRGFKKGENLIRFPMSFPRGYGLRNKVKEWMEEFDRIPYVSPYEDCSGIDPGSDLMEKRVVGVLHELLSLTLHKKTRRDYLRSLRGELALPERFTRVFTRYPGVFYLSLKCKTTTVVLREGYQRGRLVEPHPLTELRERFYYVMRMGLVHRGKDAGEMIYKKVDEEYEEEEEEEEYCEGTDSEYDTESD
ncbi:hypothetical protein QJS04_geneDACA010140 [Acorus gramineus]|uniref:PORR domain-containing protein n=1 Tax=Acorus gramineus TaxID=55184 RepID=A0AAV9A4C3_ACOGR|nr:hypothetical protein QJS04_geneDACA010140 [Acorus gramineus]